jgi:hypothetical protein
VLDEFREGDWVRHYAYPQPLRVIGTGTTIAVQFPSGVMQAFEPSELEKVPTANLPTGKVQVRAYRQNCELGFAGRFAFVVTFSLMCSIMLVLALIVFGVADLHGLLR